MEPNPKNPIIAGFFHNIGHSDQFGSSVRKCTRYREIEVEYQDMNFKRQRQKFSGWTAQIIQHECDHLEGEII